MKIEPPQEIELATIKKPDQSENISKEEFERRITSIVHSKRDISWWAENFFRIVTLDKGLQVIKLYPKQKELLQFLIDNNRTIVLATRQAGKCSTFWTFIRVKNKNHPWLAFSIPIGIFYWLVKIFKLN